MAALVRAASRTLTVDAKAVRYARHGHPSSVLKLESVRLDTASMQPSDVLVRILAAPITPVDLARVSGSASWPSAGPPPSARAPCVGGTEGLGIVEEAGASSGLRKGNIVVAGRGGVGTWATHSLGPADAWVPVDVDAGAGGLEPIAASVAPVLAAKRLLEGYVTLSRGDVVVINNGSSTVAQAVVQLASARGVRVIVLVRPGSGPEWDKLSPHLTSLGAALVVSEAEAARHEFAATLKDYPGAALALNSSGGDAATVVARALAPGGTLVTYGSWGRAAALRAPLDLFTAHDITAKGLNLDAWLRSLPRAQRDAEVKGAVAAVASGAVRLLVAREPFADFGAALARTYRPSNERKVVLTMA